MEVIAEILMETPSAKPRYSRKICRKYCVLMWEKAVPTFSKTCNFSHFKVCYGGDVPRSYYRKENSKVDCLKEESFQEGCVKRGTALKLNYEVEAPGSILR